VWFRQIPPERIEIVLVYRQPKKISLSAISLMVSLCSLPTGCKQKLDDCTLTRCPCMCQIRKSLNECSRLIKSAMGSLTALSSLFAHDLGDTVFFPRSSRRVASRVKISDARATVISALHETGHRKPCRCDRSRFSFHPERMDAAARVSRNSEQSGDTQKGYSRWPEKREL
jgi:hypothetical protein